MENLFDNGQKEAWNSYSLIKKIAICLLIFVIFVVGTFIVHKAAFGVQPTKDPRHTQPDEAFVWEWRFNKGMPDICFGNETCPEDWGVQTGYIDAMRYQCVTGGDATKIRLLTPADGSNDGTVRMGIYSDVGGIPSALLWEGTDQSYVAGAWIEEAVTGVTLVAETWYWVAFVVSKTTAEICYVSGGPTDSHHYRRHTYADPFPDPFIVYRTNDNQYSQQLCVAGGVSDVYSGKFPRGVGRGIIR